MTEEELYAFWEVVHSSVRTKRVNGSLVPVVPSNMNSLSSDIREELGQRRRRVQMYMREHPEIVQDVLQSAGPTIFW